MYYICFVIINRELSKSFIKLKNYYPVLALNGPRQSGKTTLLKTLFPKYPYFSLEDPDARNAVMLDTRRFLTEHSKGVVIDEAQRIPEIFSYIQTIVDADKKAKFVLSGSQDFLLNEKITQSLAGRVGKATLLPLSFTELKKAEISSGDFFKQAWSGFYPATYDRKIPPSVFYSNYLETYIQRDVRTLKNIGNIDQFIKFMRYLSGLCGNILNLSDVSNATGVSVNTAKAWLSVLNASYIVFLLLPHFVNFNKRLVKSPKLYFYDTGLLCYLLGIRDHKQIENSYLKGQIFENFILSEMLKQNFNRLQIPNLYFWRDHKGVEIDCLIDQAGKLTPIEIKSSSTFHQDFLKHLIYWRNLEENKNKSGYLIYNGKQEYAIENIKVINWQNLSTKIKFT